MKSRSSRYANEAADCKFNKLRGNVALAIASCCLARFILEKIPHFFLVEWQATALEA